MIDLNINIKNIDESLDYILENNCSIARFGDGEIDIISGHSIPYQEYNEDLAYSLKEIISLDSTKNFMVCLSDVFKDLDRYNSNFHYFWNSHLESFGYIYKEFCKAPWYGSTFISRPYIDLLDKSNSTRYFSKLKKLWDSKDILIVEGETSRSGIGNDLFDNANSIERIICPSKNAFSKKQWIMDNIKLFGKDKLILLMLGPTAKVISYELYKEGYWLLDLGHIDSEYEWFKMGATYKVKLDNKHTAEHNFDENIVFDNSSEYNKQIVAKYNEEKISLILPVLNNEYNIKETLESIIAQNYTNWELFILDFRAKQETNISLLENDSHSKIKVFDYNNETPMVKMNNVLDLCSGKYVSFINAGDILNENYLSRLTEYIKGNKDIIIVDNERENILELSQQETKELNISNLTSKLFKLDILKELGYFTLSENEILNAIINKSNNNVLVNTSIYNKNNNNSIFYNNLTIDKKVSVVIPVYNENINLSNCIESIKNQNYKNIEIVLLCKDENIKNYCSNIIENYDDVKIYYINKNNIIDYVTGEFVLFLNSNNWLSNNCIYELLRQQHYHNSDIVICNYVKYEDSSRVLLYHNMDSQFFIKELQQPISNITQDLFYTSNNYGKLFRTTLFDDFNTANIFNELEIGKLFKLSKKNIFINSNNYYVRILEDEEDYFINNHSKNAVVYIVRGKHVQLLSVSLASLINNYKSEEKLDVILIVDKLYFKDKEILQSITEMYNCDNINIIIKKPPKISEKLKDIKTEIGDMTLWRLFLPYEFPYYNQIFYLDNDTILYTDVSEYFNLTEKNKYIGAVRDFYFYVDSNVQNYYRMYGVKNIYNYVNSGVVVFNVNNYLNNINKEYLIEKIQKNTYPWPDQTILNIICENNISFLPLEYNYQKNDYWLYNWAQQRHLESAKDIINARKNVKLRHFIMYETDSMPWQHLTLIDEFEMDFYNYLHEIKSYQYKKFKINNK